MRKVINSAVSDGWMDGWVEQVDEWGSGLLGGQTAGWTNKWLVVTMDGWTMVDECMIFNSISVILD